MEVLLHYLLAYFSLIQASWCYFVSKTSATWTEQNPKCKMATPNIQYESLELNVTMDQPSPDMDVWVGYYKKMRAFDYIGCIKTGNVHPIPTAIQLGVSTPGRCYSACAYTKYIGIKKPECYCLETKPDGNITEQGCKTRCNDLSQTVCGGNDHISLYRISTNDTNFIQNRGEDKCLQMNFRNGEIYQWKNCLAKMWASCSSDSKEPVHIWRQPMNWYDAAKLCFKQGTYPTRLEDIQHVTDRNFYSWTGVVRSDVIYKYTELGTISSDIMYGYLTYEESLGHVLKFSQADVRKHILCENAMVTVIPTTTMRNSSTTQAHGSTTNRNDTSDNSTITQTTVTVIPTTTMRNSSTTQAHGPTTNRNDTSDNSTTTQTTVTVIPTTTMRNSSTTQAHGSTTNRNDTSHNSTTTQSSDVTIVVGVSVSVLVLIATVIVISILVRRKKIPFICKMKPTTKEPTQIDSNSTVNQTSYNNRSYEHEFKDDSNGCDDSTSAHIYHVLEQHMKNSNVGETTYDISGAERKTTDIQNDNIYNKLKPENNAIYDHAYNTTKNGSKISEVTKDTSGTAVMKPMASFGKYLDDFDENAYNHIQNDKLLKIKTDNVYCSHGKQCVGESHKDIEDTYSHINNTPKRSYKPDNLYNKMNSSNLEESSLGNYDVTKDHSGSQNVDDEYSVIGTIH